ncbi:HNH endonuclease family protein [Nocardioides sp.]|uniref:HNH endonuclease family protein n=1 Tax=Nocardioides sp. TaxID=35761 RepID=UPI003783100E
MARLLLVPVLVPVLVAGLLATSYAAPASAATAAGDRQALHLRAAVRALPVAAETPSGYDRDLFRHWVDADGDCQDTREEVLVAESRVPIGGCTITTGEWFSWYDGATWTAASDVDIDHLVPLKEAWDSGARGWDAATRERYANDLGDPRTLVAVTDNVNQSKGDRDVAEWLPDHRVCRYVRSWVAVKLRFGLTVDPAERSVLVAKARRCPDRVVRFTTVPTARRVGMDP